MKPALQATHAAWSLGATIGPFIVGQFLVELLPMNISKDVMNQTAQSTMLHTTCTSIFIYLIHQAHTHSSYYAPAPS